MENSRRPTPIVRISKTFTFSASHQLLGLPDTHKCSRLHGHNYEITLHYMAHISREQGMVIDYGELDVVKDWIDAELDHRHLNALVDPATAEMLAVFVATRCPDVKGHVRLNGEDPMRPWRVDVKETPNTSATYIVPEWDEL